MSATTINAWETGRSRPSPRTLGAVADALGVQVADLAPIKEADVHMPDLRFQAGLNQQDLADAAGLTIGILSTIELGHRQPDDKQVTALAAALGLDPAFLVAVWIRTRNARIARLKSR